MSDEEPVDPKAEIEDSCKPRCIKSYLEYKVRRPRPPARRPRPAAACSPPPPLTRTRTSLPPPQACGERIKGDKTGEAHCTGQYFDYLSCIDKCAAKRLFQATK
jgi:ubiquinol-cytochrome c reductase subunit 6